MHSQSPTAFQSHLLSLLSTISAHPSPSFPFGQAPALISTSTNNDSPTAGVLLEEKDALPPYKGSKTSTEQIIEDQVRELGFRVWESERAKLATSAGQPSHQEKIKAMIQKDDGILADLPPTPEYTPQSDIETQDTSGACPACGHTRATPLAVSLSTPAAHVSVASGRSPLATTAASWGADMGASGMSAEKELVLLKAQVQDIARVCKVHPSLTLPSLVADKTGRRNW